MEAVRLVHEKLARSSQEDQLKTAQTFGAQSLFVRLRFASNKMSWQPNPDALNQVITLLKGSQSPDPQVQYNIHQVIHY